MSLEGAAVKAASTLPIIDIAPWIEGHDHKGRLSTAAAIHAACLEYGFFYLDITSYLDSSEPEELSRLAHQFFGLPQEEKEIISFNNQDYARGAPPTLHAVDDLPTSSDRIPEAEGKYYEGEG